MNTHHDDPLSPEEQSLATRLRGLGGPAAPSASLDARILASARRAAAAQGPAGRRRWLAWSALPGSAITAIGTAAAFTLVIGLAWQLRPVGRPGPARPPSATEEYFFAVEMIGADTSPDADAPVAADVPAMEGDRGFAARRDARPPAAASRTGPPAQPGKDQAMAPDAPRAVAAAEADRTGPAASASAAPAAADSAGTTATRASMPASAAQAAPPASATARPAAPRRATYTTAALARPEAHMPRDRPVAAGTKPESARAHAESAVAFGPVAEDAQLAPAQWLERIQDRHARGDSAAAAESLQRFRRTHPRVRIPAGLRDLAR